MGCQPKKKSGVVCVGVGGSDQRLVVTGFYSADSAKKVPIGLPYSVSCIGVSLPLMGVSILKTKRSIF